MPPPQAAKSKNPKSQPRERRSRSRNTTPLSSATESSSILPQPPGESEYLRTPLTSLLVPPSISIEALIERHGSNGANPPSAANLNSLHAGIVGDVLNHVAVRGQACDRSMRELARKRKERIEAEREREEQERVEEERKRRELKKMTGKRKEREEAEDEARPPAVGAHGLARQDGIDVHMDPPPPSSPAAQVAASTSAIEAATSPASSISETSHQPPPAAPIAQYQSFGEDPTKFDDPTIYDIRDLTPDMTVEEKRVILCVADYPHDDLHDLTPGTPPDMDFTVAKPTNQVAYATFQGYVEPYVRPLTEEDVAFLKERGDRVEPFLMPARGEMPYREVWAREDGLNPRDPVDLHLPLNEPRGSIEDMNDEVAVTEEVSSGPLLARLLGALRHEPNTSKEDTSENTQLTNGDTVMTNGETTAGDQDGETQLSFLNQSDDPATFRPATYFPDQAGLGAQRLPATGTRSFASLDQRVLQEFRYLGFITPEASPDFDGHYDDEVAARLRYLQSELRNVAAENGARKARVLELTEERMAMQEYATIADDLDTQINTAYLKRNRTMSKPKKGVSKARPGQSGANGVAISRNLVSEGVRMLMDRRVQWKHLIGPVVEFGQKGIPKESVFDRQTMDRFMKAEGEVGEVDGE